MGSNVSYEKKCYDANKRLNKNLTTALGFANKEFIVPTIQFGKDTAKISMNFSRTDHSVVMLFSPIKANKSVKLGECPVPDDCCGIPFIGCEFYNPISIDNMIDQLTNLKKDLIDILEKGEK